MRVAIWCFIICFINSLFAQPGAGKDSLYIELNNKNDSFVPQTTDKRKAFEKYMDLVRPKSAQGGACFGNYLFVGHDRNASMDVYDLANRTFCGSMRMQTPEPKSRCHANTINFGNQYYQKGDEFPLLYVSSGYAISKTDNRSNFFVYRITKKAVRKDSIVFNSELVQTITIIEPGGWTECIVDNEHDAMWFRYDRLSKRCFLKYPVPDVHQKYVELNPVENPALDTIFTRDFSIMKHGQGVLCLESNFYIPIGVPGWREEPYLAIYNLEKKDYTHIVNLYDVGMCNRFNLRDNTWEPEFFFFYNGDYFLGYRSAVFKLDMELVKKENYFYNINYR